MALSPTWWGCLVDADSLFVQGVAKHSVLRPVPVSLLNAFTGRKFLDIRTTAFSSGSRGGGPVTPQGRALTHQGAP